MLSDWYMLSLNQYQLYGLIFLLGSLAVATLSDLKRMSAQREFLEIWLIVVIFLLVLDAYMAWTSSNWMLMLGKWLLIVSFSVLSHRRVGVLFRLASADVAACASVAALLSPLLIIIFFIVLKIIDLPTRPLLLAGRRGDSYPFLPVVLASTLAIMALAIWVVPFIIGLF